jgi:transposase
MLNLEDFMNIRDLKQLGWSVSAIAGELHLDRKTVRKHLSEAPQPYKRENPAPCKIDPYRPFLRERWETPANCWTRFASADMTAATHN